jgi:hypothetical protein
MVRGLSLVAVGICAAGLVGLQASAQPAAEVTLTRLDCGSDAAGRDVSRFSDCRSCSVAT